MTRKFTDFQAAQYEAIHVALEQNSGSISAAIAALLKSEDRTVKKLPWSYEFMEQVMETESYQAWRDSMRRIMMNHAEHSAVVLAANTTGLNDQARASVAVNILKGDHSKAQQKAVRGKKRQANYTDPSADPGNHSETAAMLMEEEE